MVVIKDAFKTSARKFCIRSKHGTWCTSSKDELIRAIGHIEEWDFVFMLSTSSEDCRLFFNGRRAYLEPYDFD